MLIGLVAEVYGGDGDIGYICIMNEYILEEDKLIPKAAIHAKFEDAAQQSNNLTDKLKDKLAFASSSVAKTPKRQWEEEPPMSYIPKMHLGQLQISPNGDEVALSIYQLAAHKIVRLSLNEAAELKPLAVKTISAEKRPFKVKNLRNGIYSIDYSPSGNSIYFLQKDADEVTGSSGWTKAILTMLEDLKHDVKKLDLPTGNVTTLKSYTHLVESAEIRRGVNESMYLNWKAVFVPNKNGLTNYDISQGQIPIYQDELHVWYGATDGTPSFKTINIGGVNTNEGLPKQPYYVEKLSSYEKYLVNSVGKKRYELSDHLGNVRVVFSDLRIADADLDGSLDGFYTLDVKDWTDYYAFGSAKPNRKAPVTAESYRYGFNGMEKDDEVSGSGNSIHFTFREYDPRIARFKSRDPLAENFPFMTPYQFATNNPILNIDIEGAEGVKYDMRDAQEAAKHLEGVTDRDILDKIGEPYKGGSITLGLITAGLSGYGAAVVYGPMLTQYYMTNPDAAEETGDFILGLGGYDGPGIGLGANALLDDFAKGASKLMSSKQLAKYPGSKFLGNPKETFIAPFEQIDELLSSGKSREEIAEILGITDPSFLEGDLIRVDIKPEAMNNLRLPTGNEAGANSEFILGGETSGGVSEAIIDGIQEGQEGISTKVVGGS